MLHRRLLVSLTACASLFAAAAGALSLPDGRPTLTASLEAITRPLVGAVVELPERTFRMGHASVRLDAGTEARRLVAEGRVVGLLVDGPCWLTYLIDDRFSLPVALRNLKSVTELAPRATPQGTVLGQALTGAAFWGTGALIAPFGSEVSDNETGRAAPGWLAEVLDKRAGLNPGRDILLALHNREPDYGYALLHARSDDYELDYDARPSVRDEHFAQLQRYDGTSKVWDGKLFATEIVAQPIGGTWWDPRPIGFASVRTEIDLVNQHGDRATVTTRTTIQAMRDGIEVIPLSLMGRFEDSNNRVRGFDSLEVKIAGKPADFHRGETDLLVALPAPLKHGEEVTLEIRTEGDILAHPQGNSYWMLRTQSWYPRPLQPGAEYATFAIGVESADPFVPFASGEVVAREKTPTGTRVVTRIDVPAERAVALAGKYTTFDREHEGARVHVSTYASAKKSEAERLAGIVLGVRSCFEWWLDVPFPFQDLQLLEIKDWGWGQAPPGVIFITQEAFMTPARTKMHDDEYAAAYTRGVNERIAHEVAHTWFPHVTKVLREEENWLSESFADYTSVECLTRAMKDAKKAEFMFNRAVADWKFDIKEIGEGGSIYLASHLAGEKDKDGYAWRALLYSKGPLVLHAIRQELVREHGKQKGDSMFFTWIRAYVQNFRFKTGETRHLVGILNQITGKDWQPWFERYVYGTETPKVD